MQFRFGCLKDAAALHDDRENWYIQGVRPTEELCAEREHRIDQYQHFVYHNCTTATATSAETQELIKQ